MAELKVVIIQQLVTEDTNHYSSQCSVLAKRLNAETHCCAIGIAYILLHIHIYSFTNCTYDYIGI